MWWELVTVTFLTCSSCAHSNWRFLVSFLSFLSPSRLRRISCRFARYSRMVACWVLNLSSNSSVESSRGLEVGLWGGSMCMLVTHSGLPMHDTIEAHTDIVKVAVRTACVHSAHNIYRQTCPLCRAKLSMCADCLTQCDTVHEQWYCCYYICIVLYFTTMDSCLTLIYTRSLDSYLAN